MALKDREVTTIAEWLKQKGVRNPCPACGRREWGLSDIVGFPILNQGGKPEDEYVPAAVVMHLERRITRKLWSTLTMRHVYGLGYFFWKHGYLWRRPMIVAERRAA